MNTCLQPPRPLGLSVTWSDIETMYVYADALLEVENMNNKDKYKIKINTISTFKWTIVAFCFITSSWNICVYILQFCMYGWIIYPNSVSVKYVLQYIEGIIQNTSLQNNLTLHWCKVYDIGFMNIKSHWLHKYFLHINLICEFALFYLKFLKTEKQIKPFLVWLK